MIVLLYEFFIAVVNDNIFTEYRGCGEKQTLGKLYIDRYSGTKKTVGLLREMKLEDDGVTDVQFD